MGESIPNQSRGLTVQVRCSCAGQNSECVICGGVGTVTRRACIRCGGTGREAAGTRNCIDCRGEGWRDVELI